MHFWSLLQVRLRDVTTFPVTFWLLSLVCLAYYVAIFPFISLGQVFFMKKFDFDAQSANFITGTSSTWGQFCPPMLPDGIFSNQFV
jgi:hypothetical protein